MKLTFAAICLMGLVVFTANAYTVPEEESRIDTAFDSAAQGALYLGEILRDVADTLAEDEELSATGDGHSLSALWSKALDAVQNATEKMKVSVGAAYKDAKGNIKKAVKEAQEKLREKAAEIMPKLFSKVTSALQEADRKTVNFFKLLVDVIKAASQEFLKLGKALAHRED